DYWNGIQFQGSKWVMPSDFQHVCFFIITRMIFYYLPKLKILYLEVIAFESPITALVNRILWEFFYHRIMLENLFHLLLKLSHEHASGTLGVDRSIRIVILFDIGSPFFGKKHPEEGEGLISMSGLGTEIYSVSSPAVVLLLGQIASFLPGASSRLPSSARLDLGLQEKT
ncbi:hypothetical protein ACJX0J_025650, partial [Zea mays]